MENIDKFLEEQFIPNNIIYKRVEKDNNETYIAKIRLNKILNLKKSDEEKQYIIDYLNKKNIQVIGYSNNQDCELDNYIYTRKYRGKKAPVFSPEETMKKLKEYYDTKDPNIRNEIIVDNMRLVNYAIINMNKHYFFDACDLEQAGYIGLIKAVDNYNPNKGAFSTFALSYIKNCIKMELYKLNGIKKTEFHFFVKQQQVEHEYGEKVKDNPTLAEVIVSRLSDIAFKGDKHTIENIRRVLINNPVSLDEILEQNEDENIYRLGYEVEDNIINDYYDEELKALVLEKIKCFNERKQDILKLRYGLDNYGEHELKHIADVYNVSVSAVHSNINKSLNKLRSDEDVKELKRYLHREL